MRAEERRVAFFLFFFELSFFGDRAALLPPSLSFPFPLSHLRRVLHEPALVDVPEELLRLGVLDALGDDGLWRGRREKEGEKDEKSMEALSLSL